MICSDTPPPGPGDDLAASYESGWKAALRFVGAPTVVDVECTCGTTYATYQGPEEDCPAHGRPCCIDGDTAHPHTPPPAPAHETIWCHERRCGKVEDHAGDHIDSYGKTWVAPPPAPAQGEAADEALARVLSIAQFGHDERWERFRVHAQFLVHRLDRGAIPGYGPTGAGEVVVKTCGAVLALAGPDGARFVCAATGDHDKHHGPIAPPGAAPAGTTATWGWRGGEYRIGYQPSEGTDLCDVCEARIPIGRALLSGPEHAPDCPLHRP